MASGTGQGALFAAEDIPTGKEGTVVINGRCTIQTLGGYRVVAVSGLALAHYPAGDRMAEAHAMVSLVEQGWATQTEVAAGFGCSERTVRRNQRRFESEGLAALGRRDGCPKGATRLPPSRLKLVDKWKAEGVANREIARRLGVNEKAVRKLLRRLGWKPKETVQLSLDLGSVGADPNLSGSESGPSAGDRDRPDRTTEDPPPDADPNLSGPGTSTVEPLPVSLDADPLDRSIDRILACLGLLDDAAPLFAPATQVSGAGALLAIPSLVDSGVFQIVAEIYGSIGPAFYGLRTTFATLLLMALLRIKRPEGLKEHSPRVSQLGVRDPLRFSQRDPPWIGQRGPGQFGHRDPPWFGQWDPPETGVPLAPAVG